MTHYNIPSNKCGPKVAKLQNRALFKIISNIANMLLHCKALVPSLVPLDSSHTQSSLKSLGLDIIVIIAI